MMSKKFSNFEAPPLVAMIQCHTADECINKIEKSLLDGAEAIGIQLCKLYSSEATTEKLSSIMNSCKDKPVYITSYRKDENEGKSDEECVDLLLRGLSCGAALCDLPGDLFGKSDIEITESKEAVSKQKELIDKIHAMDAEVLISSHVFSDLSADEIYRIASLQAEHGADILKVVVTSANIKRLPEYIEVIQRVNENIKKPFLFLDCGVCSSIIRRIGPNLGTCMYLCTHKLEALDTPSQPLIKAVKTIRENMN